MAPFFEGTKCTYRVQVWRADHWMTVWRGLSYWKAVLQRESASILGEKTRIAIP